MMKVKILILLSISFFLIQVPVSADCISEEDSFVFRMKIKEGKFKEASDGLEVLSSRCPENAKLELLETELWIDQGEELYKNKQFKSAFPFFKNAYGRWRTNPLVKQRYNELSDKILTDEPITTTKKAVVIQEKIELPATTENRNEWEERVRLFSKLDTLEERIWILTLVVGILISLNLVFAVGFLIRFLLRKST
ncbi:hypothetical protein LPTSP3_g15060 [Leptospira kobayashii]|uniref:Tetratricopeptide repeat protein n=1 Tax=Leptospira kobayashii TaxID=1917830 RepID=A0ABN6KFN4_9LEPT|nr:hypothetical protein [Leptospira kobayashii]BDA78576.1 hypothetical protein LPTSP3_g15060 [Leptospira kobayashii]